MQEPKISFTKWIDPLNPNSMLKDRSDYSAEEQEAIDSLKIAFKDEYENNKRELNAKAENLKFLSGPMGIVPVDEHNYPGSQYNLWNFSGNFEITNKIAEIIARTNGVELLRVWTRYRGWIGIGAMFNHNKVFKDIKASVKNHFYSKDDYKIYGKDAAILSLNNVLSNNFEHYSIYKSPQKHLIPVYGLSGEDVKETTKKYEEIYKSNAGDNKRKLSKSTKRQKSTKKNNVDDKKEGLLQ